MQKVQLHIWFDRGAGEALDLYCRLLPDSRIDGHTIIRDTPGGDNDLYAFTLAGLQFQAINGGPFFQLNPSISLTVHCETAQEVDRLAEALGEGGEVLMPLDSYPFSKRYTWLQDRWGVNWQLSLADGPIAQKIVPNLLFSGSAMGQAEEAVRRYVGLIPGSTLELALPYAQGEAQTEKSKHKFIGFTLAGTRFSAMDHGYSEEWGFTQALSLVVNCDDQAEIDRLWAALSAHPEAEACGWLMDEYGLSWQIVPASLDELMLDPSGEYDPGVTKVMLEMKKLDIAALEAARTR